MIDPTHDDMMAALAQPMREHGIDPIDAECAIYWFANDHHNGQGSNLYAALSTSEYRPGVMERGPGNSLAEYCYEVLQLAFIPAKGAR